MADDKLTDVYCPNCLKLHGRKKLLFQKRPQAKGVVEIFCRGCKEIQRIKLDNDRAFEPVE